MHGATRAVGAFWAPRRVCKGIEHLRKAGIDSAYALLASQADCCKRDCGVAAGRLASRLDPAEQMKRALGQ
jgi:biopolymer transport protein ExbB